MESPVTIVSFGDHTREDGWKCKKLTYSNGCYTLLGGAVDGKTVDDFRASEEWTWNGTDRDFTMGVYTPDGKSYLDTILDPGIRLALRAFRAC